MKKELGKWLMDIAKYILTAVILSSIFSDVKEKWIIFLTGGITVILSLSVGLYYVRDKEEEKKKKRK